MKTIELTRGKVALVDDSDYEELSKYNWCALKTRNAFYALRTENHKSVLMHRQLLGVVDADGKIRVDHENGDGLDNQRENLRTCTHAQNIRNQRKHEDSSSGFKGVYKCKQNNRWTATIFWRGKNLHLGFFDWKLDAALAYDRMALGLFGEFARINFPNLREQLTETYALRKRSEIQTPEVPSSVVLP